MNQMHPRDSLSTERQRRTHYRTNIPFIFNTTAELYYTYWGEFFHFAVFDGSADTSDFTTALDRTHERYWSAIGGSSTSRILDLATGSGAFAAWMAERTTGEVVGIDISDAQLARARSRAAQSGRCNLRFLQHDVMDVADLEDAPFDAAVCLDAGCYLPDKRRALHGVATRLRTGARFLLVDWCRAEQVSSLQGELVLEPFYQCWGIPAMARIREYTEAFDAAGFRLLDVNDLSRHVQPNWERAYQAANRALAEPPTPIQVMQMTASALRYGVRAEQLLKNQFYVALLAKAAADAGVLRYVSFLAERQ